jgi:uncharacterized membrane protein
VDARLALTTTAQPQKILRPLPFFEHLNKARRQQVFGATFTPMLLRYNRYVLALLFVLAGSWHFLHPATYLAIMPPQLPQPLALVHVSGIFEILGGLGLLLKPTRRLAAWGLLALLVAVFPANVYMALIHDKLGIPGWVAWGRLPLQLPLLWWTWRAMW